MRILINKKERIVPADCNIKEMIDLLGIGQSFGMAVAIGNKVVPREKWNEEKLHENDSVTIIEATCGG